jgi:hypothetical protein
VQVVAGADGLRRARRDEHAPAVCRLGPGVVEAYYRYYDGLLDLAERSPSPDLDGNYARSAEKALRVAILLASLQGEEVVAMRHWARGQQVAERWRADLHALVAALAEGDLTRSEQQEERVYQTLQRLAREGAAPTAREIGQRIRGMTTQDVERVLGPLVRSGAVLTEHAGRTLRYRPA